MFAIGKDLNFNDLGDLVPFCAQAASFTKAVKTRGLTGTGSNLCVNAQHKSVR